MYINRTLNVLDVDKLNDEVKASNPKIEIVMKFGADDLRFTVANDWNAADDTALDALLAAYIDEDPDQKIPKIYDMIKSEAKGKHHHNVDYKKEVIGALIPKRTIVKGEVTQVDWYAGLDGSMEPIDLIIRVKVDYTRDATGFATNRLTTRTWINRDGTDNIETKITPKYYFVNPSDMITEGYKRRKLLVQNIQIPTLTFMTEALMPLGYTQESVVLKGRAFMDDYDADFNRFVENSSTITDPADPDVGLKSIVVRLRDEATLDYVEWLDKAPPSLGGAITIRQYLMGEFDI